MGIDTLLDIISLVVRETQISIDTNSDKMILDMLDMFESKSTKWKRSDSGLIKRLIAMIKEMIETRITGESIDVKGIHRRLSLLLVRDDELMDSNDGELLVSMIDNITKVPKDLEEAAIEVKRLKSFISGIYSKEKVKRIASNMSLSITNDEIENGDVFGFIDSNISKLEEVRKNSGKSDEAIIGEIDLGNENAIDTIVNTIVNKYVFKTGIRAMNRMLQGGHRTSEMCIIAARTHNYKTGLALSNFIGMLMNNKPRKVKKGIKPQAVWMSFEDELSSIIDSMYNIIFMTENGDYAKIVDVSLETKVQFVKDKLESTGFHVMILRVNPTLWSYKDIFNKLAVYTSVGYDPQIVVVDYLDKLPTTGLYTGGTMGSEKKDLIKRVKNLSSALDIVFISPWQLSPAASTLLKDGMSQKDLLGFIHDKGFYQGSSTLSTEIDLEIFSNKVPLGNGRYALHVHKGKHKIPQVLENEKDISFFLPFPKQGMIQLDEFMDGDISKNKLEELRDSSGVEEDNPF